MVVLESLSVLFSQNGIRYLYGLTSSLLDDPMCWGKIIGSKIILPTFPFNQTLSLFLWEFKVFIPKKGTSSLRGRYFSSV